MFRSFLRFFPVFVIAFLSTQALAHKVTTVSVVTDIDTKARTYAVNLAMEVEPTGDPEIDEATTPEEAAREFAKTALIIYFDQQEIKDSKVESEILTTSDEDTPEELKRTTANVILSGKIPEDAENFLLYVNEDTEASVVMVYRKDGKPGRRLQVLYPGDFSRPNNVRPVVEGDPFEIAEKEKQAKAKSSESPKPTETTKESPSFSKGLKSGFSTILPDGTIHWVFLIGLLLLSLRMQPIITQVAAFVISHSLGLALAAFEVVSAPASVCITVMALGLVYIGLENMVIHSLKPWRSPLVFVIGLFHGFYFNAALENVEIGALIGFNLGIEIAVIVVLMIALIVLNILFKQDWYRKVVVIPLSALLVGAGFYWAASGLF